MTVKTSGAIAAPSGRPDVASSRDQLEAAIRRARAGAERRRALDAVALAELIRALRADVAAAARRWVAVSCAIKGIEPGEANAAEEWLSGPYCVLRYLRQFARTTARAASSRPASRAATPWRVESGHTVVRVAPADAYDRLLFRGITADVWLQRGVDTAASVATRAVPAGTPQVAVVLGAGNVTSIPPLDVFDQVFVHGRAVVLKLNPAAAALRSVFADALRALIEPGFLTIVDGGAEEGAFLCAHEHVDTVHVTGSDKTFEAIVFGGDEEGARRKAERRPKLAKPVTGELGNVSPVIVVPGPWSPADIEWQARAIAAQIVNNAGFNCNAARVIVQHANWSGREPLLIALADALAAVPPRRAWYPGSARRFSAFAAAHPEARRLGMPAPDELPWLLIDGLDPASTDEICFTTEAFCSVVGETAIPAGDSIEFVKRAVDFANDRLWGSLSATVIAHPSSLADPALAASLEMAIARLRYGTIGVNVWPALGYALGSPPWGAFPGHSPWDVQSGIGIVHNAAMLDGVEKCVVRAPFRPFPTPPWVPGARHPLATARALTRFESRPGPRSLAGILAAQLFG